MTATAPQELRTPGGARLAWAADASSLTLQRKTDAKPQTFKRLAPYQAKAEGLQGLVGTFRHAALNAHWTITLDQGRLLARMRGQGEPMPLEAIAPDLLAGPGFLLTVQRDPKGRVQSVIYGSPRTQGLRFERG